MAEILMFQLLASFLLIYLPPAKEIAFVGPAPEAHQVTHLSFPYKLNEPDESFELPENLVEVSGISLTADRTKLVVNNDEQGVIFLLNKATCTVEKEISFWSDGDFEGIEIVGDDAFIVKSSGTIYHVKGYASDSPQVTKMKSFLKKENDVEGLGYDAQRHLLLVGCKGKGVDGEGAALKKAVFGFDLDSMQMKPVPLYVLTVQNVQHFLEHYPPCEARDQLCKKFTLDTKKMNFNPSGIAIHPLTGNVYITSSSVKMLLVLNPLGGIVYLEKLKKSIHPQPEGLCFDDDGTLYISNEGKTGPGRIYKFRYRN